MPQTVEHPALGVIEFPDGMSNEDMVSAIKRMESPQAQAPEFSLKSEARGVGLEVGGAALGGFAGTLLGGPIGAAVGAAAGGAAGNYLKQVFEVEEGRRDTVSGGQMAAAAIMSAPAVTLGTKALKVAGEGIAPSVSRYIGVRAAQGAMSAGAAEVAEKVLDEGKLPTFGDVFEKGAIGAAFGGLIGGVEGRYALKGGFITNPVAATAARWGASIGVGAYVYNDRVDKGDPNAFAKAFGASALTFGGTYLPKKIMSLDKENARRVVLGPEAIVGKEVVMANKEFQDFLKGWEDDATRLGGLINEEIKKADSPEEMLSLVLSIRDKKASIDSVPDKYKNIKVYLKEAETRNAQFTDEILERYPHLAPDLIDEIRRNRGSYIRTTYAAHDPNAVRGQDWDRPGTAEAYKQELISGIIDEAKDAGATISKEEAAKRADSQMARMANDVAFMASGVAPARIGGEGASPTSALQRRHFMSEKAQEWLGVQKDPGVNIKQSLSAQARLIAHDVHDEQIARLLTESGIGSTEKKAGYVKLVSADEPTLHRRLADLYVPENWANAWKEVMTPNLIGDGTAARTLMKLTTTSKAMKTVGNLFEQVAPQMWGNLALAASSFKASPERILEGAKLTWKDLGWAGSASLSAENRLALNKELRELRQLGIMRGGAEIEELRSFMGMAVKENKVKGLMDKFSKVYGFPDTAFRYAIYKGNLEELKSFGLGLSETELKRQAARITNNTFPTYELIPRRLRQASAVGAANAFGAFEFEVMRNSMNQAKYAVHLIREGNRLVNQSTKAATAQEAEALARSGKAMYMAGSKRMLALGSVAATTAGLAVAGNEMLGTSKQDMEDIRKLIPDYDNNKSIVARINKDGSFSYTPLNYLMPYANMVGVLSAAINGENPLPYVKSIVLGDDLGPLLTPSIEALTNTYYGTNVQITEPRDNVELVERLLSRAFIPQAVTGTLARTEKALRGEVNKLGTKYTLEDQGLRLVGARQNTMDILGSATSRIRSVIEPIMGEVTGYRRILKNNFDPSTGQIGNIDEEAIYNQRARQYELKQKELGEQFAALKRLGEKTGAFGDNEIIGAFRQAGVPSRLIAGAAFGFAVPMPRGLAESNSDVVNEILSKPDGKENILEEINLRSGGDRAKRKSLLDAYHTIRTNDARGADGVTKLFAGLGVSDGERAEMIYRAMYANPEMAESLRSRLLRTKVMTPEVYRQVRQIVDANATPEGQ